jgi:golgin subfamily B member 1
MSVETIRMALGRLQDDPDNEAAWTELSEVLTSPESSAANGEVERLLGRARARHEQRREWSAVARLLDLELSFATGTPVEAPMQAELARVFQDELVDAERAARAYRRLLEVRPDDTAAAEALEADEAKRAKWQDLVSRYLAEADAAGDPAFRSDLLASAADVTYRYGRSPREPGDNEATRASNEPVLAHLEKALALDPRNRRANALSEIVHAENQDWEALARVQRALLDGASSKEERVAAGLRLGRTCARRIGDAERAAEAYQLVLDLVPGQPDALTYLAEAYSTGEQWDHLVALYEDQLRGGGVKPAEELGVLVQIAMVHWRMRGKPAAAEPYFDRVRRADPAHAGMLSFFRELYTEKNDKPRLITILTDAQRASQDAQSKRALASEIARLAESQENAQKAIEQYKSVLRSDPDNREARDALKRLYAQTEGYNALVELYRQDLERIPAGNIAERAAVLREIATIYRERVKSDAALVTVLSQIVQLDDQDAEAVRELCRVHEALGRWRDLLAYQQKLAELTDNPLEKANLYRASARRWMDQFSNVQNAMAAYEALLAAEPADEEAQQKLKDLYQKRRAWPQLYALYQRQVESAEGPRHVELLIEMSKLAAERLDRGAEAIVLFKRILELDPQAPGVFDALEKQAEREKDWGTVAEALEQRARTTSETPARLAVLQKLGAVYAERLRDAAATTRTWRRVLELAPGHARALRVLRESYVAAGDWDGLEELYASQNDLEGLVDFLSTAADKATDKQARVDISFRAARIFEEKLGAPERAARSYERVLSVVPDDSRAAAALVPIYEAEEKWARLPALYETLLAKSEDDGDKVGLLRKLTRVTGGPLADKAAAIAWARQAYELSPDAESLELLESTARAGGSWAAFVEAVEARLKKKKGVTKEARRNLRIKLAELYARELGKVDDAVATYRDLVEADPGDADVVRTLDALLRGERRKDDLRWLFTLRADQVQGEARAEVLEEWARLEEDAFGDAAAATKLWRQVVALAPRRAEALRALARLLKAAGDHAGAAEVIEQHRDVSEGEDRARREIELASSFVELDRPRDAFEACKRALAILPHEPEAISILNGLVERPETRALAAELLEAEYAEAGDARKEAQALRVMLEMEQRPEQRQVLYTRLADVEERKLAAAGTAFDVVQKALLESPEDLTLWDRAADLARKSGRPTDLAEAYRAHLVGAASNRKLPEAVELELSERAASLHDEQLGDAEGAMPYLERVLAVNPNSDRAFARLKQILTAAERWGELEGLYDRAAQGTTDEQSRLELLNEVALIAEEIIGDPTKAIGYYERTLAVDSTFPPAVDALEKLYEREGRWPDLAALLERRLETATAQEGADIKLTLGRIYLDRLHEPERSMGHLEEVLRAREGDAEARQLVERLLEVGALRQRAARALEAVYEARDEVRHLVRILDIRREGQSGDELRDLLRRLALLRDERLKDDAGAFAALAELLPLEPEDAAARERFTEIGRRLGEHERVAAVLGSAADAAAQPATQGEILMEVATICEDLLGDPARAESVYRRVVRIAPEDADSTIPAARALARIYAGAHRHRELAEILRLEVGLEDSVDTRRALYERIGAIYEETLNEPAPAIEAWKARLADEPADETALAALERLYGQTAQWRELVGVLRTREQATGDAAERKRTMVRAAEVLAGQLDDENDAIVAWRSVLDDFGPERSTLASLSALYEKAKRWPDLAETLEVDLSLAEADTERLGLLTRLGDVRRLHLDDRQAALESYRGALAIDPRDARSRRALEELLDVPDTRREAAETLHPLYEAEGDSAHLLRVLEIEIETSTVPGERLEKLEKARATAHGPLGDPGRAFGYAVRGLRESVGEADVAEWIARVEQLAEATGRWQELTELYHEVVGDILDGEVQQAVQLRVGELYSERLHQRPLAIEHYKKALEQKSDDRRALVALEELYEAEGDAPSLLDILRQRAEHAEDDAQRRRHLYRQAALQREKLGDEAGAISTYESILDLGLDAEATRALEKLYAHGERHTELVALYERQLGEGAPPAADGSVVAPADLRVRIARVARRELGDWPRAFDELAEALAAEPAHAGAVAELEEILGQDGGLEGDGAEETAERRARAGEMLEPVYLRRADWARVKVALEARLASSAAGGQDPAERRDLLTRLATLHEEQLEDYSAALETVAKLFHEDIAEEPVWAELERLAKVAGGERRLAEIYGAELTAISQVGGGDDAQSAKLAQRTGEIWAELGEVDKALGWYRRAHEFEPESRELFTAIDRLLARERRHEDRVALYRQSLDYHDDAGRLAALHTIAGLERVELRSPEKAIETYRAALDVDPDDARSLDALAEIHRELGQYQELAQLYLRRAEAAPDGEQAAPHRLALSDLYLTKLEDTSAAIDQLEAIVADAPWHDGAIKALEALTKNEQHKARVVEILRPLYERSDDWRLLVRLNEDRFGLARDAQEKVTVLRETARLWETRGGDKERALYATRQAFDLDPNDGETREELERLAAELGAWDELAEGYEHGIEQTDDDLVKRELLLSLARLYDERLDDPRRALDTYGRLADLDPDEAHAPGGPLEAMDMLALLLADWPKLIAVLEKRSETASDEENAALWRRIASTRLDMLDDAAGAVTAYERSLELDPESAATVDALIALLEAPSGGASGAPSGAAERRVELYVRREELADPADTDLRYEMSLRAARAYERELSEPREAIAALDRALEAKPGDIEALLALERLYRAERLWEELLENLQTQTAAAADVEHRVRLRRAIGEVYAREVDDPSAALDQYRLVLDESPADAVAIAAVRDIGETREELRLTAVEILEPVLRNAGRWEELVLALELKLRALGEPLDRSAALRAIAQIEDEHLGRPAAAEAALLRALDDTPEDVELHTDIERLAEKSSGWDRYAEALAQRAGGIFDATVAKELWLRLGRVAEERLRDDRRAVDAYGKAMESAGDSPELLEHLDRLHERLGDDRALADVLERRASALSDDAEQASLYHRLAVLQIEKFGEKSQGLATLRQALERQPEHGPSRQTLEALTDDKDLFEEASEALEHVYTQSNDNAALARLYEKRIQFAPTASERLRMRLDLARVLEEKSGDAKAAQGVLENALADDPGDSDVLAELERVAAVNDRWGSAAAALEKAVRGQSELVSETAADLWLRLAGWYKDKAGDAGAAERAFEEALKHDPTNEVILRSIEDLQRTPGRERELVGTLRRLASLDGLSDQVGGSASDLRREAKSIAESSLSDRELTEAILGEMIEADDADIWALAELAKVREQAGDWRSVFDLTVRQAELTAEAERVRELRHTAADVARSRLGDAAAAIALYQQIFEDEPSDQRASNALRVLYAEEGRWRDLRGVLERLVDQAESPADRNALRLEAAGVSLEKLDELDDATTVLRAVLDEDAGNEKATVLLSQLYEKQGRDDDLAELLAGQIDLARERADVSAELTFRVRLGEVYETRLGDAAKAIDTYAAVIEREPRHKGALLALARLHESRGEKAEAAAVLERVVEEATGGEALGLSLRLADLFAALGDDVSVRRVLERALAGERTNTTVRERLRALYQRQEAWTELAALIEEDAGAASDTAEQVRLYRRAADIHQTQRADAGTAADLLEKASALAPGDRELLLALCDAYSASGRGAQAAAALQRIVESYGGRRSKELAAIHHRLATAYAAEGDKEKALAELDVAFKIDPGSISVLRDLGVLSLELAGTDPKDPHIDRAQKTFRALLLQKLDDKSPLSKAEVFYYLAEISHRQGDDKKALQMLERALDNDKQLAPALELMARLKSSV